MGWWGHGIMDGDSIRDIEYSVFKFMGLESECINDKITLENKRKFVEQLPKIIKELGKNPKKLCVHDKEDLALFWQSLFNTLIENKINLPPFQISEYIASYELCKGVLDKQAKDFNKVELRQKELSDFNQKVNGLYQASKKLYLKHLQEKAPLVEKKVKKIKVL